jgi:hypothetical protein
MPCRQLLARVATSATLAGLAACSSDGPSGSSGTPGTLTLVTGGQQEGQVGLPLPLPVEVRVTSTRGGALAGVRVTFATGAGSGFLSGILNVTDASGLARATWTLGQAVGEQTLTVAVEGLPALTVLASARPGPAAQVFGVAGTSQHVVVGRPVPVRPQVRVADVFGNSVTGAVVTFRVTSGGGIITDSIQTTGPDGLATLGSWTLGPFGGVQTVRGAIAGNIGANFQALGLPASLALHAGNGQTANTGTLVATPPAVIAFDDAVQPLSGVSVSWQVQTGGGRILGSVTSTTGNNGIATAPGWVLGPTPGTNTLQAVVPATPPVLFTATGVQGLPAAVNAASPIAFEAFAGNFLAALPAARVVDADGRPVADVVVQFELVSGGGLLLQPAPVTDHDGVARPGVWRLGPGLGPQVLRARVAGAPPLEFTATAVEPPPSQFNIDLRFTGGQPTDAQRTAFERAATRWRLALIGDLPDVAINRPADQFGCYPAMNEVVDDVVIFVQLIPIDGPGGVLGQARPCLIRTASSIPAVGIMQFDIADLAILEAEGLLEVVILHEMGHVIGFFHFAWPEALASGLGTNNPFFRGPTARMAFLAAGGAIFPGDPVPLENAGGPGSRDSHWRQSVMGDEIMTSQLSGPFQPLSAITLSLFRDFGFLVNDAVAEAYSLPGALQALVGPRIPLIHGTIPGPIEAVDRQGRTERILHFR